MLSEVSEARRSTQIAAVYPSAHSLTPLRHEHKQCNTSALTHSLTHSLHQQPRATNRRNLAVPWTRMVGNYSTRMESYYNQKCHHKDITCIKIFKYLLLCSCTLLLIGLAALCLRLVLLIDDDAPEKYHWPRTMLLTYLVVGALDAVCLTATVKENFFFLVTSAAGNVISSIVNLNIDTFSLAILFLQFFTAALTFIYTMSVYWRMKMEIRRKRRKMMNKLGDVVDDDDDDDDGGGDEEFAAAAAAAAAAHHHQRHHIWLISHDHRANDNDYTQCPPPPPPIQHM